MMNWLIRNPRDNTFFGVVPKWETGGWDFSGVTVLLNASRSGLRDLIRLSAFLCSLVGHDLGVGEQDNNVRGSLWDSAYSFSYVGPLRH
jgi:hypothetical protein